MFPTGKDAGQLPLHQRKVGNMDKYDRIATDVLEKVGGKENVTFATHCVTRLRLNVRDKSVIDLDAIKGIRDARSGGPHCGVW